MNTLVSTPYTQILVRKKYLQQDTEPDGLIEAFLVGICVVLNEAPKLMVMTEEGAMFCYVPPHAVCFEADAPEHELGEVCRWDCLADRAEVVLLEFLKDFGVRWQSRSGVEREGRYLFSLHFDPRQAWGRIPEQLKIFHFVEGDDGNLHIVVNNQSRWLCEAVSTGPMALTPESNQKTWFSE